MKSRLTALLLTLVALAGLAPQASAAAATQAGPNQAIAILETLRVEAPKYRGYDRGLFEHWVDANRDSCDTRREVILEEATRRPRVSAGCRIDAGRWVSAYDGLQAKGYPARFDVDHLVPLAEAYASGAHAWSENRRRLFANDLVHPQALILVSATSNRSKSDKDPARWLPPLESAHCGYAVDWVRVKAAWGLSVDRAEKAALLGILQECTGTETLVR